MEVWQAWSVSYPLPQKACALPLLFSARWPRQAALVEAVHPSSSIAVVMASGSVAHALGAFVVNLTVAVASFAPMTITLVVPVASALA